MNFSRRCSAAAFAALLVTACANEPPIRVAAPSTTTSTTEPELDLERVARDATFRVRNRTCFGAGTGTGFLIDDRTLITNRHVVEGALELEVETWDGRTQNVAVASQSIRSDLAVIELDRPLLDVDINENLLDAPDATEGDEVTILGYPLGGEYTSSTGPVTGYVDGTELGEPFTDVLSMDLTVKPGNSGGPVLDTDGRLVAIVYAMDLRNREALAIPVAELAPLLDGRFSEPVRNCLDG